MKANDFQEWLKTTPEYQTLVFQHGERLFIQRDGEFEILTVRLVYRVWLKLYGRVLKLENDMHAALHSTHDEELCRHILVTALRGDGD